MSRVSRRKTLSHSEIENFLSEINVDEKQVLRQDIEMTAGCSYPPDIEVVVDPMRTEVQSVRDFCRVSGYSCCAGVC